MIKIGWISRHICAVTADLFAQWEYRIFLRELRFRTFMACGRSIFELVSALMVLGCNNFYLCKKIFYQRTQNNDKTCF